MKRWQVSISWPAKADGSPEDEAVVATNRQRLVTEANRVRRQYIGDEPWAVTGPSLSDGRLVLVAEPTNG